MTGVPFLSPYGYARTRLRLIHTQRHVVQAKESEDWQFEQSDYEYVHSSESKSKVSPSDVFGLQSSSFRRVRPGAALAETCLKCPDTSVKIVGPRGAILAVYDRRIRSHASYVVVHLYIHSLPPRPLVSTVHPTNSFVRTTMHEGPPATNRPNKIRNTRGDHGLD